MIEPHTEHQASASRSNCSQVERLHSALYEAGEGTWVPMPELARAMSNGGQGTGICVSRRIYDLRRKLEARGFTIEQSSQWADGVCHSFYRIIRLPAQSAIGNPQSAIQQPHPSP